MGFVVDLDRSNIEVIASIDSAIGDKEAYEDYLVDLDESKLKLTGEPTRFIMRRVLPYAASEAIKKKQMSYVRGEVEVNTAFIMEEVRCALIDIKNPPDVPEDKQLKWKRENDGYCSKSIIEILESVGVLQSLYLARTNALAGKTRDDLAKKK